MSGGARLLDVGSLYRLLIRDVALSHFRMGLPGQEDAIAVALTQGRIDHPDGRKLRQVPAPEPNWTRSRPPTSAAFWRPPRREAKQRREEAKAFRGLRDPAWRLRGPKEPPSTTRAAPSQRSPGCLLEGVTHDTSIAVQSVFQSSRCGAPASGRPVHATFLAESMEGTNPQHRLGRLASSGLSSIRGDSGRTPPRAEDRWSIASCSHAHFDEGAGRQPNPNGEPDWSPRTSAWPTRVGRDWPSSSSFGATTTVNWRSRRRSSDEASYIAADRRLRQAVGGLLEGPRRSPRWGTQCPNCNHTLRAIDAVIDNIVDLTLRCWNCHVDILRVESG